MSFPSLPQPHLPLPTLTPPRVSLLHTISFPYTAPPPTLTPPQVSPLHIVSILEGEEGAMTAEDELVIRASHAAVRDNGWVNAASECARTPLRGYYKRLRECTIPSAVPYPSCLNLTSLTDHLLHAIHGNGTRGPLHCIDHTLPPDGRPCPCRIALTSRCPRTADPASLPQRGCPRARWPPATATPPRLR